MMVMMMGMASLGDVDFTFGIWDLGFRFGLICSDLSYVLCIALLFTCVDGVTLPWKEREFIASGG